MMPWRKAQFLGALCATAAFATAPAARYGPVPLAFEENRGQTDARVRYLARSTDHTLFLTAEGAVLRLSRSAVRLRWRNANSAPRIEGSDRLDGLGNYLGPHPVVGVPRFARVRYHDVWRGIDVVFYGTAGQLEYDFVLAPGSNPGAIRLELEGAGNITSGAGGFILHTPSGELRQRAPVIYQDGRRVEGAYVLRGRTIGFQISRYDKRKQLVIDPVLSYVARFGARSSSGSTPSPVLLNSFDRGGNAITVDAAGNAYVVGSAFTADFPTTPGAFQPRLNDSPTATNPLMNDVFVMKLNPSGSALVYSTFLGGSADDIGVGIAIDPDGNAYVCGLTSSADLPITQGAFQTIKKNSGFNYTAFVAKLNPTGSALVYSTFLGGSTLNDVRSIALDSARNVYVTGWTASADFPITPGAFQPVAPVGFGTNVSAAYVTKINAAGTGLVYSTFLGPVPAAIGAEPPAFNSAIAVDSVGNAYIGGAALGSASAFPTTPGALAGQMGGFVSKLNADGSALVFSTLIGGLGDGVDALTLGPDGSVYAAGRSISGKFPTTPGSFQPAVNPEFPLAVSQGRYPPYGFVARLKGDGSGLLFSTYIGGGGSILVGGIAVDSQGNVFLAGSADSAGFVTTPGAVQPCTGNSFGLSNAFLMELDPTGRLLYSTFLGGNAREQGFGLALDKAGNPYVSGMSDSTDFAPTPGAAGIAGGQAFIAKLNLGAATPFGVSCIANTASMTTGPVAAGEIVSIFGNGLGPAAPQPGTVTGGAYDTSLAGTQVLFDGVPAPLLMVQNNQVNAVVPSGVRFRAQTVVQVSVAGSLTPPLTLSVAATSPAIFSLNGRGAGQAAVLNQDGTINSPANPAERGSYISVYANGVAPWNPAMGDGLVVSSVINRLGAASLQIGSAGVFPTYVGNSPGQITALWQINALVPSNFAVGSFLSLRIASSGPTQRVTVAVK